MFTYLPFHFFLCNICQYWARQGHVQVPGIDDLQGEVHIRFRACRYGDKVYSTGPRHFLSGADRLGALDDRRRQS